MTAIPFQREQLQLYVITDVPMIGSTELVRAVAAAIAGGATMVQYRDKGATRNVMYERALRLRQLTWAQEVPFVVNDFVDLAVAAEADGVHLGQTDLPLEAARRVAGDRLWFGVSTHSRPQAEAAALERPAYIAIGPVFRTTTKENPEPVVGLEGVRQVRTAIGACPLVGIGGITVDTAEAVRAAGADGICAIGAVWSARDVTAACRVLRA